MSHEKPMFNVRSIEAYQSCYPNPIQFTEGDIVEVGKEDDEYPGWIWTMLSDGNSGWAPLQLLSINGATGKALSDYSAIELSTTRGEKLLVLEELNGWYWVRNKGKQEGWIPASTTSKVEG